MAEAPRGTVTFLFTDVEGSTRRWEEHRSEMASAMEHHDRIVRGTIVDNGGTVFTTAGDQFCAAFATAAAALAAAIEAQTALAERDWGSVAPFRVRMALHTGRAEERDGDYFGPPLNRCARLLSIGHGGQVLASATTAQLVAADLGSEVRLVDLGQHALKDLEQPERVYQVDYDGMPSDLPELRSAGAAVDAAELISAGRQSHAAQQWSAAYDALSSAASHVDLESDDLTRLGDAAFWSGHADESVTYREQAFGALAREGRDLDAAMVALDLAHLYKYRLAGAVSKAWLSRAEKLVGDARGTDAYGYLVRFQSVKAFEDDGDAARAVVLADEVIATADAIESGSLRALGLMDKGRFMVAMGEVDAGMRLVDESMVAVVAGDVDADATGRNYCNMLAVCDQVADYQRAAEWSDAAEAWCEQHSDSAYPGICRIFRAELKWLRGDWVDAAGDLERAVDELSGFTPIIGAAMYQMGLVRLRSGDLPGAEELFRAANERGFPPLPGLAELRLEQGEAQAAEQLLLDALLDNPQPLDRAKYLPTLIDAILESGDLYTAVGFLDELAATAELCNSDAMRAEAADRRGSIAIAQGRPDDARRDLREAIQKWTTLQMPYEVAQSRLRLADALSASGNEAGAVLERDTAVATIERLAASSQT